MKDGLSAMKVFLFVRLQNVFILLQGPFSAMHVFDLKLRSGPATEKFVFAASGKWSFNGLQVVIQRCLAHLVKLHRICLHHQLMLHQGVSFRC